MVGADWAGAKEWVERRGAFAVANLPYFDALLARQPFLAGTAFTMADITLFAGLMFMELAGLPIGTKLEALRAWRATVGDLPAVKERSGQTPRAEDTARQT